MGWLFHLKGMERGDHYGKDLYDDRLIRGIDRMYFVWVTLSFALPFAVGYAVGGASWKLGLEVLVWGGLIRVFAYQHATFSVNSICHMFGRRSYRSRDESRNNWVVAALTFGEGWHNNHHAFPASARHGLDRLQLDIAWITIRTLEKLGLAWNVHLPSETQRAAAGSPRRRPLSAWKRARCCSTPATHAPARGSRWNSARPAPDRGPMEPAGNQGVGAFDAERPCALEAALRAGCADPGDPRQVAIPGAVEDIEALAAEPVQRQPLGNHGARPSTPVTSECDAIPIETAPPIENPTRSDGRATRSMRRAPIGHARVELVPRLEPVAHLDEGQLREAWDQLGREQLAGGAPRARHRASRAPVEEDHGERRTLVREPRIGAAGELNDSGHCAVRFTAGVHDLVAAATARARSR